MGREALLDALRARALEDRETLWRETRAAVESHRAELERVASDRRAQAVQAADALAARLDAEADAAARRSAREQLAAGTLALAERCLQCARDALPTLREGAGPALFDALAAELPPLPWTRVRVHPDDGARATERFAGARVESDAAIAGGLLVETEGGRVRVGNTLQHRLEAAWPDLLPALLRDLAPPDTSA